ncbi:MAG: hypothetical protein JWP44_3282 [Mucilaginibacter sp.]|nr:hypothetical protein [Mucilaginibacter sp.]
MGWWQYLVLVNIYLLLFYGFYVLLLCRETFFQLNRIYLVLAALLSFFIPVIQSNWVQNLFITQRVKYTIYTSPVMFYQFKPIQDTHITVGQVLTAVYIGGIVFLTIRFIRQLIALNKIIDAPHSSAAYSFFNKIRLGDDLAANGVIAAHENVHASQWHSADVLLIEAVMIINWFNPIVYLYRLAIKHIHEFIADRQAVKSGTNKETYALLLLSQTFNTPSHQLVNPFFTHSLLKQRIIMLQKNNSRSLSLVKYCLSVPLFVLMLILSSATVNKSSPVRLFNNKVEQVFLTPATHAIKNNIWLTVPGDKSPRDTILKGNQKVFNVVEQPPGFRGGVNAFYQYLGRTIRYPAKEREHGIQGKVIITFIIEKDGSLSNVHLVHGVATGIDEETLRVIKASPNWIPGKQNGKSVRVAYTVPISFSLGDGDVKPAKPAESKTGAINNDKNTQSAPMATAISAVLTPDSGKKDILYHLNGSAGTPLYLVDGKEVENLSAVNPNNIQSISVLKDKIASATYGTKGAFGVVVVTTKK